MSPQSLAAFGPERPRTGLLSVDGRTYPLRNAAVRARAEGGLALTTLVQEFHNPYEEPLEVLYTMPLPVDGAVLGYAITLGDRVIRGEIEVREKAEARFREALYNGQTAGLLEENRPDTFQQRLGNIPPKTDVTVKIDVLQKVAFLGGSTGSGPSWEYRFPTVAGVRYQGAPGRVPDAGRLDANRADDGSIPVRCSLDLVVADESAAYAPVTSASHAIEAAACREGIAVQLAGDARLDRDLVVRWAATVPGVGVRMVEGCGLAPDDGRYALLTITPPTSAGSARARDLTVLLDSSGSMTGFPIELAKSVVEKLLRTLGPEDRFEILSFSSSVQRLTNGPVAAKSESVEKAIQKLRLVAAGGATEMESALADALRTLRRDSQRQVVLVTDGQIGFEKAVIARLSSAPANVRVHVVGIGYAPNRSLTAFLARAGRGLEVIAQDEESADHAAARLSAATARPLLTDISVGGPAVVRVAPGKPRDVLAGEPLVVALELSRQGGAVEVAGELAGQKEAWSMRFEVPASGDGDGFQSSAGITPLPVGALFGREVIADLEAEAGADWQNQEVIDQEIEQVALRHQITSRRTSLVAILEEPTTDPLAPRRRERLAVELPAGISAEGAGLADTTGPMLLAELNMVSQELRPEQTGVLPPFTGMRRAGLFMPLGGRKTQVIEGTVIHRSGAEILIELEVPYDGFLLPESFKIILGLRDILSGSGESKVRVVPERSAPKGPHPKGVIIRLALLMEDTPWPESEVLLISPPAGRSGPLMIRLQQIPADEQETPAR